MGVKSLKMPPANQAFNRIAAEITLDLATRPKDRSSLGPYHPHLIACLGWAAERTVCHGHRTRQACENAHRDRVDHTVSAGRSGCHSTRDPASWNHRVRGKSGRNRRASEALSARRTIPSSAEDKEAKTDRTLIPPIYMIEFRERFAQALLVHSLSPRLVDK